MRQYWTPEQDEQLKECVNSTIPGKLTWNAISKALLERFGTSKSRNSCYQRYKNYLAPDLNSDPFTKEEEDTILYLQPKHGNKWEFIASQLNPGRTGNSVKNWFNKQVGMLFRELNLVLAAPPQHPFNGEGPRVGDDDYDLDL